MVEKYLGRLDDGTEPTKQEVWYEEKTDKLIIRETEDVDTILANNRYERNMEHGKPFGEWKKIACIPGIVVNQLIKDGIFYNQKRLQKYLNKSEWKNLRTKEGEI